MGQIASTQKEKKGEIAILLNKQASIVRLFELVMAFSTQQVAVLGELGFLLKEASEENLLSEKIAKQCPLVSMHWLTNKGFEETSKAILANKSLQEALYSQKNLSLDLSEKKKRLEENSKPLLESLEDIGNKYMKSSSEYKKMSEKALLALNNLGEEVMKAGMSKRLEEMKKKSSACHEMAGEISDLEVEVAEQTQMINTILFSLSNLTMAGVNETKQMLGEGIGYFFSLVSEANKIYQQCFSQIRSKLFEVDESLKTQKSIGKLQEIVEEQGFKLLKEEIQKTEEENSEVSFEEFQSILRSLNGGRERLEALDIILASRSLEKYGEAWGKTENAQKASILGLKSTFEQISSFAKEFANKSSQIFKANGLASDSDSFYTLMLKTFSTQAVLWVKNFFVFHDLIRKKLLEISQTCQKSAGLLGSLIKARERQVSFARASKILEMLSEMKLVYQKNKSILTPEPGSEKVVSALGTIRGNILTLLEESIAAIESFKEDSKAWTNSSILALQSECQKTNGAFLVFAEDAQRHCQMISGLIPRLDSVEANTLASIQIDPNFNGLVQKSLEPNQMFFSPQIEIEGFKMRLAAADEVIRKAIEPPSPEKLKATGSHFSMADFLAAKITSVPKELTELFGVPENEPCKAKYSCTLLKGILPVNGDIWLFEKKMCFHPTSTFSKNDMSVSWSDVLSYEFPSSELFGITLQINTKHGVLEFASFKDNTTVVKSIKELAKHVNERELTQEEINRKMSQEAEDEETESANYGAFASF